MAAALAGAPVWCQCEANIQEFNASHLPYFLHTKLCGISNLGFDQGLHLIAILPDHEFRFSRANDHDLIRLERFTLVTYKKRGKSG